MFKKVISFVVVAGLVFALALAFSAPSAMAAIITGDTSSATSEYWQRPAVNASNNSGITINGPDLATDGQVTHNNAWQDMWMCDFYPQTAGRAIGVQLTVDLGANYDLDGMRIWNFNENAGTDTGIENYDLEISSDGSSYSIPTGFSSVALAQANSSPTYNGVYTAVTFPNVRYVRYTINDTYRNSPVLPDDAGGFSEVMFSGSLAIGTVPGDLDGDSDVDLDDVALFEVQFGSQPHGPAPGPPYTADFDEDDDVDLDDFTVMRDNFGYVSAARPAATPEPATITLLAIGGMIVLRRRSRKA